MERKPSRIAVLHDKLTTEKSLTLDEWKHVRSSARRSKNMCAKALAVLRVPGKNGVAWAEIVSAHESLVIGWEEAAMIEEVAMERIAVISEMERRYEES